MKPDLVIALDIGSTYSGYACLYRDDNPTNAWMNNRWGSTNTTNKTKTCVLIKEKDKELVAIGDDAEMQYMELYDKNESYQYHFFKNFKMILYNESFKEDEGKVGSAEDYYGRHEPITFVMAKFIEGLKRHCLNGFKERNLTIQETNIRWVLTVPAIWNDDAKGAMRKSAVKAGIPNSQLILALEPEAAAIHCMYLSPPEKASMDGLGSVGDKFMIVDLGGGTVDITAVEVTDDGYLRQILRANGGPWGGQRINDSFSQLVRDVFRTEDGNSAFARCTLADLLKMEQDFENQKVNIREEKQRGKEWIKLPLPGDIWDEVREELKVNPTKYSDFFRKHRTGLTFNLEIIPKELFGETIALIVKHLQLILNEESTQGIEKIVLVGGFAEAPIVQQKIREALSAKKVFVPRNPLYAVLNGAVLYGHNPDIFKSRICRFTYGVKARIPFDPDRHDEKRKVRKSDGSFWCMEIFDVHVRRDQIVALNQEQPKRTYSPFNENQNAVDIEIYQSVFQNPTYVDDNGCKKLGTLRVEMPDTIGDWKRNADVTMIYGGTELRVNGVDKTTGKEFKTSIAYDRYTS